MVSAPAVRNIIFDLDGTLLDSRPGIVAGLRHALRRLGRELPADFPFDWAVGPPLREVIARLLAPYEGPRIEEGVAAYREWYSAVGLFDARPYSGVPELLDALAGSGKALFVGTSKRTDFARSALGHFGLAGWFRAIYGAEPHGRLDHKADLLRHVVKTEALAPEETMVVGDREHDVFAARANGLRVAAVAWGYGSPAELAGADLLCHSPAVLLAML
jgi:phosphoglycolate phosphatase